MIIRITGSIFSQYRIMMSLVLAGNTNRALSLENKNKTAIKKKDVLAADNICEQFGPR